MPSQLSGAARIDALIDQLHSILGSNFEARVKKLQLQEDLNADEKTKARALAQLVLGQPMEPSTETLAQVEHKVAHWAATAKAQRRLNQMVEKELSEQSGRLYDEIRMNLISRTQSGENASTLEKFAELTKNERRSVTAGHLSRLRPSSPSELFGQERAFKALMTCLCTPYPQHVLLFGPPGVGKTTAARLALSEAKRSGLSAFDDESAFIEADGSTLRHDPREGTNPLIGSVHDPIYQGAKSGLARDGMPEPRTGLVSKAHGGVLFLDEIGEMDTGNLNKLLKVLEDKRVFFHSSYYDPAQPNIPKYIRQLFDHGAPADFVLIGATTRRMDELPPALLSRCACIMFDPLSQADIDKIVTATAGRLGIKLEKGAAKAISASVLDGREAVRLLQSAYGCALQDSSPRVAPTHVKSALDAFGGPVILPPELKRAGAVSALGVSGRTGCVLTLEVALEDGSGEIALNEAAGLMARDAVRHAFDAVNRITKGSLSNKNAVFNCVGGGKIDGPSIGLAAALALFSALSGKPLPREVAVTGEISLFGDVLPVGGIHEKLQAAARAGYSRVFVPERNFDTLNRGWPLSVDSVSDIRQALHMLGINCAS